MEGIRRYLIHYALGRAADNRNALEIEESATKVAALQGGIAGYKDFVQKVARSAGLPSLFYEDEEPLPVTPFPDMTYEALLGLQGELRAIEGGEEWAALGEDVRQGIDEMKHFLLHRAEKGRDLFFTQARHKALTFYTELLDNLDQEVERQAKEIARKAADAASSLDFGDGEGEEEDS